MENVVYFKLFRLISFEEEISYLQEMYLRITALILLNFDSGKL